MLGHATGTRIHLSGSWAMTRFLAVSVTLLLAGCTTLPPVSKGVTLSVLSYDSTTGDYLIELRNNTVRPILYLDPYLTFDTVRSPAPEPFPESAEGMALMVHNTKLAPGESASFFGSVHHSWRLLQAKDVCGYPGLLVRGYLDLRAILSSLVGITVEWCLAITSTRGSRPGLVEAQNVRSWPIAVIRLADRHELGGKYDALDHTPVIPTFIRCGGMCSHG